VLLRAPKTHKATKHSIQLPNSKQSIQLQTTNTTTKEPIQPPKHATNNQSNFKQSIQLQTTTFILPTYTQIKNP
jgi:hypothetical protein